MAIFDTETCLDFMTLEAWHNHSFNIWLDFVIQFQNSVVKIKLHVRFLGLVQIYVKIVLRH